MKFIASLVLSGLFSLSAIALQLPVPSPVEPDSPEIVTTEYDLETVIANREQAEQELEANRPETHGEAVYIWKCATCHDPLGQTPIANRAEGWVGPWLGAESVNDLGEAGIRDIIMVGTARMPGWQYTLSEEEVDHIIAYLRTVTTTAVSTRTPLERAADDEE